MSVRRTAHPMSSHAVLLPFLDTLLHGVMQKQWRFLEKRGQKKSVSLVLTCYYSVFLALFFFRSFPDRTEPFSLERQCLSVCLSSFVFSFFSPPLSLERERSMEKEPFCWGGLRLCKRAFEFSFWIWSLSWFSIVLARLGGLPFV